MKQRPADNGAHHQHTALERISRQLDQKIRQLSVLEHYNKSILASMTSGLFTLDLQGRINTFNAMAETITGLRHPEVQGRLYDRVFAENMSLVKLLKAARYHRTSRAVPRLEFRCRNGRNLLLDLRLTMLRDDHNRIAGLLAIFDDLTPLQMLERQRHYADRLASLSQMASGIAHEIKNPLTSIRMFAQLVSSKHHDSDFIETFDRIVPGQLDRIHQTLEELLELIRPTPLQLRPTAMVTVLLRVIDLYAARMRQQRITLRTAFPATMPGLLADAELLFRCFAQIVLNAIEAMPEGGELTIGCRPLCKAPVETSVVAPGTADTSRIDAKTLIRYASDLEVSISDTGAGIPNEQLETLFVPFQSTISAGTGLGLALAYKIVEEHRGHVRVRSQIGHGTTITVMLPASPPDPEAAAGEM